MKEMTLACLLLCLMGCAQNKENQSNSEPPTQEKTTDNTVNLQGCDKSSPNVGKAVETDNVNVSGPSATVKASMVGVWSGFFLTSISLPFAAVMVPISELEAGDDSYTKKLKDGLSKKTIAPNICQ